MNEEKKITRRGFLNSLITGGLAAWAAGFIAPVASYLWPVQRRGPSTQTVSAGKVSDFAPWQSKTVAANGHAVIVVRTADKFRAFSAICTHLGCIVQWSEPRRQFACPCHAGFFDTDGRVVSGPPPRPLMEHNVIVLNGDVMVKLT